MCFTPTNVDLLALTKQWSDVLCHTHLLTCVRCYFWGDIRTLASRNRVRFSRWCPYRHRETPPPLIERRPIPRFSWSLLFISCLSESLNLSVLLLKNKFMVFIQAQGRFQDLEKQNKKQVAYWGGQKKSESEKRWKKHVGYQFQAHGVTWKMVLNHRLGFILNFFVKWQHSQRVATNSNQTLLTISCIQ